MTWAGRFTLGRVAPLLLLVACGRSSEHDGGGASGGSGGGAASGGAIANGGASPRGGGTSATAGAGADASGANGGNDAGTTSAGTGNAAAGGAGKSGTLPGGAGADHGTNTGGSSDANTGAAGTGVTGGREGTAGSAGMSGSSAGSDMGGASGASDRGGTPPSCAKMTGTECQGGDCCESPHVTGGGFTQGSGTTTSYSATVSDFRLDRYEVTVARFRAFVNAYDAWRAANNPSDGDGANPHIDGSGWSTSWTSELPADSAALLDGLNCGGKTTLGTWIQTWSDAGNDTLPVNCVDWYTAEAFCIWDGGRLPTESEWEYAAAGGSHEYLYPWGDTPVPTDKQGDVTYAVYACVADGSAPGDCTAGDILPVGSKPDGKSAYAQEDLAGSVWEWVFDANALYPTTGKTDYASIPTPTSGRTVRGGGFNAYASQMTTTYRREDTANLGYYEYGLRCARSP